MNKPTNVNASKPHKAKPWFVQIGFMNTLMLVSSGVFALMGFWMVIKENGSEAWQAFLFFGACFAFLAYGEWSKLQPQPKERVSFDEWGITRTLRTGKKESIAWQEIDRIRIFTSDEGPFVEDFFWMIEHIEPPKGCAIENGAQGMRELLAHLQGLKQFEGFDNHKVIEASGCTQNAEFLVWIKQNSAGVQTQT